MGKTLIIAEKPSVARDIAAAIGGFSKGSHCLEKADVLITNAIGHLVELHVPEAEETGRDLASLPIIPANFGLRAKPDSKSQFAIVKSLMNSADVTTVVNACDAGREGELIFRLIYDLAKCKKNIRRMWLQSMTSVAIKDAWNSLQDGSRFQNLADAARCRNEADWIVGINASRAISGLRHAGMSAGRVQTPTLAILVRRELEIQNFKPKDFWEVHASFAAKDGIYSGIWTVDGDSQIFEHAKAEMLVAKCRGRNPSSVKDVSKETSKGAPRLFDLTTLQREANKRFKFSAKKTLELAQALYEKYKATTYPRTDSNALPEDYVSKTKDIVAEFISSRDYGVHAKRIADNAWVKPVKHIFDNSKISDHFAIIPTGTIPTSLDPDTAKIYDLIVRRFLAAFHPPAKFNNTTRTSVIEGEHFRSSGTVLLEEGWLVVYGRDLDDLGSPLVRVDPKETVKTDTVDLKSLQTRPPARFTEATLLAAMEGAGKFVDSEELRDALKDRGLGTPATRAAIIEVLLNAKDGKGRPKEPYVVREGKQQFLVPSLKGIGLIQFLESCNIEALVSPGTTGEWECKLRQIEKGQFSRTAFMGEIASLTRDIIHTMRTTGANSGYAINTEGKKMDIPCPDCNGELTDSGRTIDCGCGFKLWKSVCKRALSDSEINLLLTEKKTGPLHGLISSKGKSFSASLVLQLGGKVEFTFENSTPAADAPPLAGAKCPACGKAILDSGKTYKCTQGCLTLWKEICGHKLTKTEAKTLINTGKVGPFDNLVSKANKKFTAQLTMDNAGKVTFVFL